MRSISDLELVAAQQAREDQLLDDFLDDRLDVILSTKDVGLETRTKLHRLLKSYAKVSNPYRQCVLENMSHLGPGRTERLCMTLKKLVKDTAHWHKVSQGVTASIELDEELEELILGIDDDDLEGLVGEVMARGQL